MDKFEDGQEVCFFYTDVAAWHSGAIHYRDEDGSYFVAFHDEWMHKDFSRRVKPEYIRAFSIEAMCELLDDHDQALHYIDDIKKQQS